MSGSANKGWLRWCYSLVESSMNDAVRSNGRSVLPPLLCRGPGVEPAAGRESGVLTHCWVLRHQAPANSRASSSLAPRHRPPTSGRAARARTLIS
jgi:hypothetical protein